MKTATKQKLARVGNIALWTVTIGLFAHLVFRFSGVVNASTQTQDISKARVVMYSSTYCPFCLEARYYFAQNKITYYEYKTDESEEGRRKFEELGGSTVPLIIIGKHRIQGMQRGKIAAALADTPAQQP